MLLDSVADSGLMCCVRCQWQHLMKKIVSKIMRMKPQGVATKKNQVEVAESNSICLLLSGAGKGCALVKSRAVMDDKPVLVGKMGPHLGS